MIAEIQSFFAGTMLQTMHQKNRQDFEMNLYQINRYYNEKAGNECKTAGMEGNI